MQIFEEILFFKATNNTKTNLAAADGVLSEGCAPEAAAGGVLPKECVHKTGQSLAHILLEEPNRPAAAKLLVFVLFVALKKRIPSKICWLSCLLKKRSV